MRRAESEQFNSWTACQFKVSVRKVRQSQLACHSHLLIDIAPLMPQRRNAIKFSHAIEQWTSGKWCRYKTTKKNRVHPRTRANKTDLKLPIDLTLLISSQEWLRSSKHWTSNWVLISIYGSPPRHSSCTSPSEYIINNICIFTTVKIVFSSSDK